MVKLQRIPLIPLAKILCALQAVIGIILGVIVTIGSLSGQEDDGLWSFGAWSLLIFPVVNAVIGFLTGLSIAWAYNLFAQWFGGIEFELEEKENHDAHLKI